MTTALEKTRPAALDHPGDLTEDQVELVKRTIAKGASTDELTLFVHQCNRMGLDPFARQIYAIKRWNSSDRRETLQTQVSIDGQRLIAERTGVYGGQQDPQWCGPDGDWVDVWLEAFPPAAARVRVVRKDWDVPCVGIARWEAYKQMYKDKKSGKWLLANMWSRMGPHMLAKCAESLALRKAFPQELSGAYTAEEMGTTDEPPPAVDVLPAPSQGAPAGITQARGETGNTPPLVIESPQSPNAQAAEYQPRPPAAPGKPPRSELADNYVEGPPPPEAAQSNFERMVEYATEAGIPEAAAFAEKVSPKTQRGAVKARWSQAERDAAVAAIDELAESLTAAAQLPDDMPPDFGSPELPKPVEDVGMVGCREMCQKISVSLYMGLGAVERRAQEYLGNSYSPDAEIPRDLAERFWSVVRAENKGEAGRG